MGSSLEECGMVIIQRGTLVKVALASVGRGPSLHSPESWRHQIGSNSRGMTAESFCRDLISLVPQTPLPSLGIRPTLIGMGEERTANFFSLH